MIVNRIFKGLNKRHEPDEGGDVGRAGCAIFLFAIVLVMALVLKLVFWILPDKTAPLLAEADGLLRYGSMEEAQPHTSSPLLLPSDLLGSSVKVIGIYTKESNILPKDSAVIVLQKENWRFTDITFQPKSAWDLLENRYKTIGTRVQIGNETGYLVDLPATTSRCLPPTKEGIGACELQTLLLFPTPEGVITLAGDGTHITDGELLTLARDIASQLPKEETEPPETETSPAQ